MECNQKDDFNSFKWTCFGREINTLNDSWLVETTQGCYKWNYLIPILGGTDRGP
jgi:hypothetical protein